MAKVNQKIGWGTGILCLVVVILLIIYSMMKAKPDPQALTELFPVPEEAMSFLLDTVEQNPLVLQAGKKQIINFWTTWCDYCKEELPLLQQVYETYREQVITINMTNKEQDETAATLFAQQHHLTLPIGLDVTGDIAKKYQVVAVPTTFFIDEDGRIVHRIMGPMAKDTLLDFLQDT